MRKTYEAWEFDSCTTLGTTEGLKRQREQGLLDPQAILLFRFEADSPEEASAVFHIKMGWEPYKPMGEPAPCPHGCGSLYYPGGSAECPKCGPIECELRPNTEYF